MKDKIYLLMLLLLVSCTLRAQLSNIRVEKEASCGYYIITFDLDAQSDDPFEIKLTPYLGSQEIINPIFVYGNKISIPAKDIQLFWNPLSEGVEAGDWKFRINAQAATWTYVQGGSFMMGSNDYSDEKPIHEVSVSSFYISKYEITQKEWQEVMGSNPSYFKGDKLPVENISWYDAIEYCNKRSIKEGLKPCYSGSGANISCDWTANGYRLPTEAEWEYAARGGKKSKGYKYSGSDDIKKVAWYKSNSGSKTHPVGENQANELGIYDMSGNVWEWCWDWYSSDYYSKSPSSNPRGPSSGEKRVLRGGSWSSYDCYCRVANRFDDDPDYRYYDFGLRILRAIQ